jgi:CO/xanthine dehydrogenase Mo-binding subunit
MEVGGGFGGKFTAYLEPLAALLSKKSGHRPVKMVMSRSEVLMGTGPGAGAFIRVKMGADAKGRISAAEACLYYEAGAFPGSSVGSGANTMFASYQIPNFKIEGYGVVLNKPKTFDYRASTSTIAVAAAEVVVDELCEKLGMDPLAFRLANGVETGDERPGGQIISSVNFRETIEAARSHSHYSAPLGGTFRGRGVAAATWGTWGGKSSAKASLNSDGTIELVTGSVDLSGTQVTLAMQFAETVGVPVDQVKPGVGDTESVGFTDGSYGSRTTFATGIAVHEVGQRFMDELIQRAARLWGTRPEMIRYDKGLLSDGRQRIDLEGLASRLEEVGGPLSVGTTVDTESGGRGSAVHIADVEVDPDTGKVELIRYTAFQEVGRAIHPGYVEGQIQGAVAQGVGWTLHEEYIYDEEGRLINANLLDYRLPTCPDLPMIDTVILEIPNPDHPFGVRGVGELPILPVLAAIANGIYDAIGVRMNDLPISPPKILAAVWEKGERAGHERP